MEIIYYQPLHYTYLHGLYIVSARNTRYHQKIKYSSINNEDIEKHNERRRTSIGSVKLTWALGSCEQRFINNDFLYNRIEPTYKSTMDAPPVVSSIRERPFNFKGGAMGFFGVKIFFFASQRSRIVFSQVVATLFFFL